MAVIGRLATILIFVATVFCCSPGWAEDDTSAEVLLKPTFSVDDVLASAAVDRAEQIFENFDPESGDLNTEIFGDWVRRVYIRPGMQVIVALNDPYNSLVDYAYELLERGEKPKKMIPLLVDRGEQSLGLVRFKGLLIMHAAAAVPDDLTLLLEDDRGSTFSPLPGTLRIIPAGQDKYYLWASFGHVEEVAPGTTELEPILLPTTRRLKLICITSHERRDLEWNFRTGDF